MIAGLGQNKKFVPYAGRYTAKPRIRGALLCINFA